MNRKTLLLFGGSGLLGTRIRQLLSSSYIIISPTHQEVDLASQYQIEKKLSTTAIDVIVYAAGVTDQDRAEQEREYAIKINAEAIGHVANTAKSLRTPVIYLSSDAVFDGKKQERSYTEEDRVNPVNYYGVTKIRGENSVLSASNNNLVIRLVSVYTSIFSSKSDFARIILKKLEGKVLCEGIIDQYSNPTFSDDAVHGLCRAIEKNVTGILHFGSVDSLSNFMFAKKTARKFGFEQNDIIPVTFEAFFQGKKAKRGRFTRLSTAKSQKILGSDVFHLTDQNLERFYIQRLQGV